MECNDSLDWLNGLPRLDCREGGASRIGSALEASKGDAVFREAATFAIGAGVRDSGIAKFSRVGVAGVAGGETGIIDSVGRGGRGGLGRKTVGFEVEAGKGDWAYADCCPEDIGNEFFFFGMASSRSLSFEGAPVNLDIMRPNRPDFDFCAFWGEALPRGEGSGGGPSARKSINSCALRDILVPAGLVAFVGPL